MIKTVVNRGDVFYADLGHDGTNRQGGIRPIVIVCVTALFWIFGLVGMLFRSKKERVLVEEHLLRICNIKS